MKESYFLVTIYEEANDEEIIIKTVYKDVLEIEEE